MIEIFKYIKMIINFLILTILVMLMLRTFLPSSGSLINIGNSIDKTIPAFSLNNNDIKYRKEESKSITYNYEGISDAERKEVLNRAKAMTEVKWIAKYNLLDSKASYTFQKGKVYSGIPYSMDIYQVKSTEDFLSKINNSNTLYGNDCSGFVSSAWGISRQTTLTFYNAVKNNTLIDGRAVFQIEWKDLKPGDALLMDNGKGHGHIVLFVSFDSKNGDIINVYEQNIQTTVPYEPIPVARKDLRSKTSLTRDGYFPIRIS